jgi:hypothetical protein
MSLSHRNLSTAEGALPLKISLWPFGEETYKRFIRQRIDYHQVPWRSPLSFDA